MHVPVGGEGLTTNGAGEGPLARVHKHVPVKRAVGAEHLVAHAAVVDLGLTSWVIGIRLWLHGVVATDVEGELTLVVEDQVTDGAVVVARSALDLGPAPVALGGGGGHVVVVPVRARGAGGPRGRGCLIVPVAIEEVICYGKKSG